MKQFFILLLIYTGLIDTFGQNKPVIVAGNIIEPKSKIVALEYEQSLFENKKRFIDKVDTSGSFSIRFMMDYAQNVSLEYNDYSLTLFLHPGDSIYISFNGKKSIESVNFSGIAAIQNLKINLFDKKYGKIRLENDPDSREKELSPVAFKKFIYDFRLKCDSMVYSLNADKETTKWMKFKTKYRCFEFLYEYGRDRKIEFSDPYFDFVNTYFHDNEEGLCHNSFADFVDSYIDYNLWMNKSVYDSLVNFYKIGDYNSYLNLFVSFYGRLNSFLAKAALAKTMYKVMRTDVITVEKSFDACVKVLNNEQYTGLLNREIENYKNQLKTEKEYFTIKELATNEFVGEVFTDLFHKYGNKVLYLDFWGIGCSWCIKEFPYAKALHESLLSEDIVFVYLCSPANKEVWAEHVKKYDIKGVNYLLTADQWKYLQYFLDFGGTPRYMIIDKQGQFVNTDADRPSDGVTIKEELIKYTRNQPGKSMVE